MTAKATWRVEREAVRGAAMDRESLLASLSALSGGLRPGPGASNADLEEARTLSAYEILRGRGAAFGYCPPVLRLRPTISSGPVDPSDARSIFNIADSALAGLTKNPSAFANIRIFRRENPILTPLLPDSVPPSGPSAGRSSARLARFKIPRGDSIGLTYA